MIRHIYTLVPSLNDVSAMAEDDGGDTVRRGDFCDLLVGLRELYEDPVLKDFARLVSMAAQAVNNAAIQSASLTSDLETVTEFRTGGFDTLRRKVYVALLQLGYQDPTHHDMGLEWRGTTSDLSKNSRQDLLDQYASTLLTAEVSRGAITLAWPTLESLQVFLTAMDQFLKSAGVSNLVSVVLRREGLPGAAC